MAAGKGSDFKIHDEFFQTRFNETLAQNGNAFNAASRGAIRLSTASKPGNYSYETFFKNLGSSMVDRRDVTSVGSQEDTPLTADEQVFVKLNRKMVPIANTRDSFRKVFGSFSSTTFSGIVAEQMAEAVQLEMLNTSLGACAAALRQNNVNSLFTQPSNGTLATSTLVDGLALLGDRADRIVCWVMHSKAYYNLVKEQVSSNITGISNFNVANATPVTLNRPVVVTDSSALKINPVSPDVNNYITLGLTQGALDIINSESQEVVVQDVTGLENLVVRIQGEYAYSLGVKGFKYDIGSGGANPSNTAVFTGTNWDTIYSDVKNRAGVAIQTF